MKGIGGPFDYISCRIIGKIWGEGKIKHVMDKWYKTPLRSLERDMHRID